MPEVIHSDHSSPDVRPSTTRETEAALLALPVGTLFISYSSFRTFTENPPGITRRRFWAYTVVAGGDARHRFAEVFHTPEGYQPLGENPYLYTLNDFPRNWKFTILRYGADGEEYYA